MMNLEERIDLSMEHIRRMNELARNIDTVLPSLAKYLRRMEAGDSSAEYPIEQWQSMAENMAQLRSLLQRQQHSVPVIGYADCTR